MTPPSDDGDRTSNLSCRQVATVSLCGCLDLYIKWDLEASGEKRFRSAQKHGESDLTERITGPPRRFSGARLRVSSDLSELLQDAPWSGENRKSLRFYIFVTLGAGGFWGHNLGGKKIWAVTVSCCGHRRDFICIIIHLGEVHWVL